MKPWEEIFDRLKAEGWSLVYSRIYEEPYGLLWMVDAKYYGTGHLLVVKATSLDEAFEEMEAEINESEPSQGLLM